MSLISSTHLNPALLRMLELMLTLVLAWHWIGCIWWFLRTNDDPTAVSFLKIPDAIAANSSSIDIAGLNYISC